MAVFSIEGVKISGISACVPRDIWYTMNYDRMDEKEKNLFIRTVGVESRRIARKEITTLDLCRKAAEALINDLKWIREEIHLLIFVTQSDDYYLPSNATIIQDQLQLSKSCMAFNIGMGCSGYVYGLSVAASIIKATGIKKALLMAGDISTVNCSYEDKSVYPLFGDAGTATAIETTGEPVKWSFNLFTDGSGYQAIYIPDGGMRNKITQDGSFTYHRDENQNSRTPLHLALKGIDIFNFSVNEVPRSVRELLAYENKTASDIDYFVFHQANKLMNETIRKKLGIEIEKVPYSIHKFGNTSSASIPLTIVTELGKEARDLAIFLSGFGVGLSWGNASLRIGNIVCPDLIEY